MDKKILFELVSQAFKSLTPQKVSVFQGEEADLVRIRVVSGVFQNMPFSNRFELLNDLLEREQPSLYSQSAFVFEAPLVAGNRKRLAWKSCQKHVEIRERRRINSRNILEGKRNVFKVQIICFFAVRIDISGVNCGKTGIFKTSPDAAYPCE